MVRNGATFSPLARCPIPCDIAFYGYFFTACELHYVFVMNKKEYGWWMVFSSGLSALLTDLIFQPARFIRMRDKVNCPDRCGLGAHRSLVARQLEQPGTAAGNNRLFADTVLVTAQVFLGATYLSVLGTSVWCMPVASRTINIFMCALRSMALAGTSEFEAF